MGQKFHISRITGELSSDLDDLRLEARREGYRFVERLVGEWESGQNRFEQAGESMMIAYEEGVVVAIGGITVDPVVAEALRMRRFYVRNSFRRQGLAQRLAEALLKSVEKSGKTITVNAGTPDAPAFWEAMGFERHEEDGHTHIFGNF